MKLNKIHSDKRGDIYTLTELLVFPEITLFKTNKGMARGGCIHNINREFVCVLEGNIRYTTPRQSVELEAGDTYRINSNTPHYFESLTDSLVVEWGATPEEKAVKHPEFRKIVEEINKR